jgi:hypothetical protein
MKSSNFLYALFQLSVGQMSTIRSPPRRDIEGNCAARIEECRPKEEGKREVIQGKGRERYESDVDRTRNKRGSHNTTLIEISAD